MSDTKFTPGPWEWNDGWLLAGGSKGHWSEELWVLEYAGCGSHDTEATEPDRNLIAAAPDLYAALEASLEVYVTLAASGDCGNWDPEDEPHVISARAALAKARGET